MCRCPLRSPICTPSAKRRKPPTANSTTSTSTNSPSTASPAWDLSTTLHAGLPVPVPSSTPITTTKKRSLPTTSSAMSMSMWASTSAEESNPAWLATQLGFISPSKPLLRLYIACSASSKPLLRLYIACSASSEPRLRLYIACSASSKPLLRLYIACSAPSKPLLRLYIACSASSKPCFRLYIACSAPSKPLLRLYTLAVHRRSIFCYGCSSHRESITKPSCSISSSSASPQKLFCGLASPSSMLCEVTINPKTECSVIGESTSVFGEMYVRFIFSIYKNHFTNTLRPFMI